jgi:hypothetical protein
MATAIVTITCSEILHSEDKFILHGITPVSSICLVVAIGVGTAMRGTDYNDLATKTANLFGKNELVAIVDPNPGNIVKLYPSQFLSSFLSIQSWLQKNTSCREINWFLGGHSASGRAVVEALQQNLFKVKISGFIGLDPYDFEKSNEKTIIRVPSLIWSFSKSCLIIDPNKGGLGFYSAASYDVSTPGKCITHYLYKYTDKSQHCVFADKSCLLLCGNSGSVNKTVSHEYVAESIHDFVTHHHGSCYSNINCTSKSVCAPV